MAKFAIHWLNPEVFNNEDQERMTRQRVFKPEEEVKITDDLCRFEAFDDDDILYFKGTCRQHRAEDAFDWCMWDSGRTRLELYTYATRQHLDTFC